MANQTRDMVECEVRIDARPEIVFKYLTDPERVARWAGTVLAMGEQPGDEVRILMSGSYAGSGTILEVDPPRRLVYTWGWDEPNHPIPSGSTRVEMDLTPDGDGTHLRLRHLGLPLDAVSDHTFGWNHHLDRLVIAATGGDPGPFEMVKPATEPAPTEP